MNRNFRASLSALAIAALAFAGGCCSTGQRPPHADLKSELPGKWLSASGGETIEFLKDGTVILVAIGGNIVGNYRILDDRRIRVEIAGLLGAEGPQVFSVAFSNAVLSLTSLEDQVFPWRRMTGAMQMVFDGERLCARKKFSEAAAKYRQAAELGDPDGQACLGDLYVAGEGVAKDYALAVKWYQKAAPHGDSQVQNNLSWVYATCPDTNFWNGASAVSYALKAVAQGPEDWTYHDTLAAAYARNSQFDEAVAEQEKSIKLMKDDPASFTSAEEFGSLMREAEQRLELYRNRQPFCEDGKEPAGEDCGSCGLRTVSSISAALPTHRFRT
jgi:hypothetical protein